MKRFFIFLTMVVFAASLCAQPGEQANRDKHHPEGGKNIETLLPDLTAAQKTRIDIITRQSKKNVEAIHKKLDSVRDSIRSYMDSPEDHSDILFPLYEREGRLQAEISKEYYRAKVAVDQVLTPEQYKTLSQKMKEQRPPKQHPRKQGHKGGKNK